MFTRSWSLLGLIGVSALVIVACGGNGGGSGDAKSASIKSMPAYPDPNQKKADPAPEPAKSKDPKQICAGAPDLKVANATTPSSPSSSSPSNVSFDDKEIGFILSQSRLKAKDATHSMADLQALEKRSAWEELLQHAEDVPPAQRSAAWDKLVEKAAIGYMQMLTTNTAAFEGVFTSQGLLKRYPHLLKSPEFMTKRGEAGKAASEICLRDSYRGQHCIEMMTDFLKTTTTGADVGFAFGKITRKHQNHYVAVPFFKWALDQKGDANAKTDAKTMCGDEDLKLATIAGLGLPPDYDNAVASRQIAANLCWDGLKAEIKKQLIEGSATGYYRDNACAVMKAKGDL